MPLPEIALYPIPGLPEISPGLRLPLILSQALRDSGLALRDFDVLVIAHKIVSKAEGRIVPLSQVQPSSLAMDWADQSQKDPRVIELALQEARRVVRMENGVLITETRHGFICANSGVDTSNVPAGYAVLLPEDPDASAEELRRNLAEMFEARIAVIVSDTFGRPWREGLVNVAIGLAGFNPVIDYRGTPDTFGKVLRASIVASADELAGAAEIVMGKTRRVPAVLVRGFSWTGAEGTGKQLLRAPSGDLFR
ncbi:MAG: coenzyme F420-0:L-glutamate ligase [Acidobacteria bacterium]|nr:MAG: coenzyme F420-0:L-glutamate ligase [Acidobacteriota bacterium]